MTTSNIRHHYFAFARPQHNDKLFIVIFPHLQNNRRSQRWHVTVPSLSSSQQKQKRKKRR
jgi:hypothetical protein